MWHRMPLHTVHFCALNVPRQEICSVLAEHSVTPGLYQFVYENLVLTEIRALS